MSVVDFKDGAVQVSAWRTDENILGGESYSQKDKDGNVVGYVPVNDVTTVNNQTELDDWLKKSPFIEFHTNVGSVACRTSAAMGPKEVRGWKDYHPGQDYTNALEYASMSSWSTQATQKLRME